MGILHYGYGKKDMRPHLLCIHSLSLRYKPTFMANAISIMEQDGCPLRMLVFIYLIPNLYIYLNPNHYGSGGCPWPMLVCVYFILNHYDLEWLSVAKVGMYLSYSQPL